MSPCSAVQGQEKFVTIEGRVCNPPDTGHGVWFAVKCPA